MYRFWDSITGPLLEVLRPGLIVEIGSDFGPNTRNLIEFCQRHDAKLHVIDPLPKYEVAEWKEQYGEAVEFHLSLSLDALYKIEGFDVVFVDGDHNWYTVFNELRIIEERCYEVDQPFPLVVMHDIGWPYGRRDGYYDPDQIPEVHRNAYERKGMKIGSSELLDEGGFNKGFRNALREGGSHNGVLSAVEDFVSRSEQEMDLLKVSGLHGLGILVPAHFRQNEDLSEFLQTLNLTSAMARHLEVVEDERLRVEADWQQRGAEIRRLEAKREREVQSLENKWQRQNENLRAQNQQLHQQLKHKDQQEKLLTDKLVQREDQSKRKNRGSFHRLLALGKRFYGAIRSQVYRG